MVLLTVPISLVVDQTLKSIWAWGKGWKKRTTTSAKSYTRLQLWDCRKQNCSDTLQKNSQRSGGGWLFSSKGAIAFKKEKRKKKLLEHCTWTKRFAGKYLIGKKKSSILKRRTKASTEKLEMGCVFMCKLKHISLMNPLENFALTTPV